MKLLLDENLSPRLVSSLADLFPGSLHLDNCGLRGSSDDQLWEYARRHEFAIVTKDSDFEGISSLRGSPPKVVHLGLGNCSTTEIIELIRSSSRVIKVFLLNEETAYLLIGRAGRRR